MNSREKMNGQPPEVFATALTRLFVLTSLTICSNLFGWNGSAESISLTKSAQQPNILLIVLDDLGFNDLGANGNPLAPTPRLDTLAEQGIRYTRHYTDSTCSVARVALLTGRFPAYNGFRPSNLGLSPDTPTLANSLQKAGYLTQHIGKWHVGNATLAQSPKQAGFDHWFGFLTQFELQGASADGLHFKRPTYRNPWLQGDQQPMKQYPGQLTDILTQHAIDFLNTRTYQQNAEAQPWFLNLWYYAPHAPIQPSKVFEDRHPSTDAGRYYALIEQLDSNIGLLLETLDKNQQTRNTLVIVVSDNGGTNFEVDNNYPFYGRKTQFHEGALHTPLMIRWPHHINSKEVSDNRVSIMDIYPTLADAAGLSISHPLDGTSLFATNRPPTKNLYWEYTTSEYHMYSVLSADSRWRLLTNGFGEDMILNDLQADSRGEKNVAAMHPHVVKTLTQQYITWRHGARVVKPVRQSTKHGGQVLTGSDLQRSPGYNGYTFAMAVTPEVVKSAAAQVIVEQPQRWRLTNSQADGLQLTLLGTQLQTTALPTGQCSEIVISSHHLYSMLKPNNNRAIIDLYVNGKRVDETRVEKPALYVGGYTNATYLGHNASGGESFHGRLGQPIILNERLVLDKRASQIGNGISSLPALCPQQQ